MVKKISLLFLFPLLMFGTLSVQAGGFGVRAGTLGAGLEWVAPIAAKVSTRFGVNTFTFDTDGTEDNIDYQFELKLSSVSAMIDWHPWAGHFRLSGGLLLNQSRFDFHSVANQVEYDIGDETYTGDITVDGQLSFRPVAPYVGFGWGMAPPNRSGLSFTAEFGAVFQGGPTVDLDATGLATSVGSDAQINVTNDALFQENLKIEENKLKNDIDQYNIFPVVALGLIYRF